MRRNSKSPCANCICIICSSFSGENLALVFFRMYSNVIVSELVCFVCCTCVHGLSSLHLFFVYDVYTVVGIVVVAVVAVVVVIVVVSVIAAAIVLTVVVIVAVVGITADIIHSHEHTIALRHIHECIQKWTTKNKCSARQRKA